MKHILILAALLGTAAQAATLHQYDGVAIPCVAPVWAPDYNFGVNRGCGEGTTHYDLWLRDDNTLDRIVYRWDRPGDLEDFSAQINRNTLPATWRTEIVMGDDGWLRMNIWESRWRMPDPVTGAMVYYDTQPAACTGNDNCISPMPKAYGLYWTFKDMNNWSAWNSSSPYEAGLSNGTARMGLDSWWMIRSTVGPHVHAVPEPSTLLLLLSGCVAVAMQRRRV